jgi:transcriptional regulator with XRE-family HTH domain
MEPGTALRRARYRGGWTQRALARRSGVPQPAIARIESGAVVPRVDTLERLLNACGQALGVERLLGTEVDRTVIRQLRRLTPRERLKVAEEESINLDRLLRARRRS